MKKLALLLILTSFAFSQTRTSTLSLNRIQYADQHNWTRFPANDLSAAGAKTITLASCPYGLDFTNTAIAQFTVYISGVGTPEVVNVTGGSGTGGSASCTVNITTANTHSAGYQVSSSSGGIQEAINDASTPNASVVIPPLGGSNQYFVRSPIFMRTNKMQLSGYGAWLKCLARSGCIMVGATEPGGDTNDFNNNRIRGIRFSSGLTSPAITITNHEIVSNVATMTTGSAHSFVVGDMVTIINTFPIAGGYSFDGARTITVVPDNTHFKFGVSHADIASAADVGAVALTHAAIVDNSNGLKLEDILIATGGGAPTGLFHSGIVVLNDQAFTLEKFSNEGSGSSLLCDATFCGSFIYGPGPFNTNAGIGYLRDLDIGGCSGNGVDWANGNTLHITDSIIQAVKQFAIRSESAFDVNPSVQLDNVYLEVGSCTNPVTGMGISGVITKSGYVRASGGEPLSSKQKLFANTGSALQYNYFVVIHSSTNGFTAPYLAGYATLASATGTVNVYWPQEGVGGTIDYDVIRTSGTIASSPWPYTAICNTGGSTSVCGSRTTASSGVTCALGVCTFADDASANTTAYTFSTNTYVPTFNFWPGSFVLGGGSRLSIDSLRSGVTASDSMVPKVFATECASGSRGQPGQVVCLAGDSSTNSFPAVGAMVLQNSGRSGGTTANIKGRINFLNAPAASLASQDLITAVDTAREKTIATAQHRPSNDAADTAICLDQGSAANTVAQLCLRAPVAISNYINSIGDGTSYKERLTSTLKSFTVPVSWTSAASYLFSGSEQSAPANPSAGLQRAYFKAGSGLCSRNSAGTEFCPSAGGGAGTVTSIDMTVPAELTIAGNPIINAGTLALTWTAPSPTSAATANAIVKRDGSGNASFAALTASSLSFSGAGPWAAESLRAAASAPSTGANSKVSFDADGLLYVWESDGATSTQAHIINSLSALNDLTGILDGAHGGTNNGFMQFTGPTTSLKTFSLPNASATILTSNTDVTVAQGGTGISSGSSGGIPYFSSATSMASTAVMANHGLIVGKGAGAAPITLAVAATDTVIMGTTAADPSAVAVNNCGDATHALSYNTGTHAWGCQAIVGAAAAGGADTQVQWNDATALNGGAYFTTNKTDKVTIGVATTTLGKIDFCGNTSGCTTVNSAAAASGTLTLPAATDTLTGKATTDTLTNKTVNFNVGGNVMQMNSTTVSTVSGTTSVMLLQNLPTIITPLIVDSSDPTKKLNLVMTGISTGTTRNWTVPNFTDTFVGLAGTQTLTNKTLTTPTIADFTNATHTHANAAGGGQLTSAGLVAANKTHEKCFSLLDPATGDSSRLMWQNPQATTITRLSCNVKAATSVTINIDKRAEATPQTAGTNVLSGGLVCDTNNQTSCSAGCDVNTITSASLTAHNWAVLTISAVSGTPDALSACVEYTID